MRKLLQMAGCILLAFTKIHAQNTLPLSGSIGIGTVQPASSSILHLESKSKGFLPPRMSRIERDAIVDPARGLIIYQNDEEIGLYLFNGFAWVAVSPKNASRSLGNLNDTTAINADLLPAKSGRYSIGSPTHMWESAFFSGPIGIGTTATNAKLAVNGKIRITDGSEGDGKVLMSNASGLATWKMLPKTNNSPWTVTGNHISNNNSGNVGIGTTTPLSTLDVRSNSNPAITVGTPSLKGGSIFFGNPNHGITRNTFGVSGNILNIFTLGNPSDIIFSNGGAASPTERMRINTAGLVGIGTTTPTARLDIQGDIKIADGTEGAGKVLTSDATGKASWQVPTGGGGVWTASGNHISNINSGNVGIGTNAPNSKLDVRGGSIQVLSNSRSVNTGIGIGRTFGEADFGIAGVPGQYSADAVSGDVILRNQLGGNRLILQTGGGAGTMTLLNGNVGIGTKAPNYRLDVSAKNGRSASFKGDIILEATASTFGTGIIAFRNVASGLEWDVEGASNFFTVGRSNVGYDLSIYKNGDVGIGTGNVNPPTAKLSVNGTANNTTGAWSVFSDSRVKKNIGEFTDGLNVIKQIRTVKFNYNEKAPFNAEGEQIGVVAQELEKVAPYMVSKKAMGDMKDLREVNNQAYPFLLINAVKELSASNDAKEAEIAELKKQNEAMKSDIAAIKAMLTNLAEKPIAGINQQQVSFETASLEQNIPNPPSGNFTKINYNIPNGAAKAELVIIDNAGRKIKTIHLNTYGKGVLNVDTKGLASGTYTYTMYVDGMVTDSKKMVIAGR